MLKDKDKYRQSPRKGAEFVLRSLSHARPSFYETQGNSLRKTPDVPTGSSSDMTCCSRC